VQDPYTSYYDAKVVRDFVAPPQQKRVYQLGILGAFLV